MALNPADPPHVDGQISGTFANDLIWHEYCHAFGYLKDLYKGYSGYNTDPIHGGYAPDDATYDVSNTANCGPFHPVTNPINNNVMGATLCREQLSARQIAAFHYLVAKGVTKKFTQYKNTNYPYSPPSYTMNLTGTQTITSIPPFSTLTIKSGANITIKKMKIKVHSNGKIVVEPGAKLTMNCVSIEPTGITDWSPAGKYNLWQGIEVWGQSSVSQSINPVTGLDLAHGILDLTDCYITRARVAILGGQSDSYQPHFSTPYYWTGGGIVYVKGTTFHDNFRSVKLLPGGVTYSSNLSTFDTNVFEYSPDASNNWAGAHKTMIELHGVRGVTFLDNIFDPHYTFHNMYDTMICIKGINSSVNVKKVLGNFGNEFYNADYGIYLVNGYGDIINDNFFWTRNGIYISNSAYDQITNNNFRMDFAPDSTFPSLVRAGLYLDGSYHFKVENNDFWKNANTPYLAGGVYINNSGGASTKIYNNTFTWLNYGAWCQGENWDPVTADGLKLQCNDFVNCAYNIGVQGPWFPANPNTGIAPTQGGSGPTLTTYVRNTYSTPNCGAENKFFSLTPYATPPQVQHPRFLESAFSVTPQPTCSEASEIADIVGVSKGSSQKTSYCQNYFPAPTPAAKQSMDVHISSLNGQISEWSAVLDALLDGGNTPYLLQLTGSNTVTAQALKDTLLSKEFLSDTVLLKYFRKPGLSLLHFKPVFVKNSPVTNKVWQRINAMGLPSYYIDTLQVYQSQARLSARAGSEAPLSLARGERSYEIMHKVMWFLRDSATVGIKDSLAALIILSDEGNVAKQLIELDLKYNDFDAAGSKIDDYMEAGNSAKTKYGEFKLLYIQIMLDSSGLYSLNEHPEWVATLQGIADDAEHPCSREAQNLLFSVFQDKYYPELKLQPDDEPSERPSSYTTLQNEPKKELATEERLINGVTYYPNPAGSELTVRNQTEKDLEMDLYTATGLFVSRYHIAANGLTKISTEELINGIYFLNLCKAGSIMKTGKLVIVK